MESLKKHQNEVLNDEGISNKAHLEIKLVTVDLNDIRNQSKFNGIEIQIKFGNFVKNFRPKKVEGLSFVFEDEIDM